MRNLLRSHGAFNAIDLMCELMDPIEDARTGSDESIARGAVYFIGTFCWGAHRIPSLEFSFNRLLPAMVLALRRKSDMVDQEVLLSFNRLVYKYAQDLTVLDWDNVLEVLATLRRHCLFSTDREFGVTWRLGDATDLSAPQLSVPQLYNGILVGTKDFLTSIDNLTLNYELESLYRLLLELASGNVGDLGRSVAEHGTHVAPQPTILSQNLVGSMLEYFNATAQIEASDAKTLGLLSSICELFFVLDQRPRIRAQVLSLVERLYTPSAGNDLLDRILIPRFFSRLPRETDPQIAAGCLKLLAATLADGFGGNATDTHFTNLVSTLVNCASLSSALSVRAASILCETFVGCFRGRQPPRFGPFLYQELIKFLGQVDASHLARLQVLSTLRRVIADDQHRVWLEVSQNEDGSLDYTGKPSRAASSFISFREADSAQHGEESAREDSFATEPLIASCGSVPNVLLPIASYVEQIVNLLRTEGNWDVFSAIMEVLPQQLSNFALFRSCRLALNQLRTLLCESINNDSLAPHLTLPKNVKRTEIYQMAYHLLTSLISYRAFFSKAAQDDFVLVFQLGLTKWPTTARPCVHSLLLCLHELPSSMTKYLPNTLIRMAQVISSTALSVHILEFLSVLARMPALYANFVDADFKRVFGIALHYIQHSAAVTSTSQSTTPSNYALGQFVIYLSYHVVTVWFMNLPVRERRRYVPFIIHFLGLANGSASTLDERIEVLIDMLLRYTYSNSNAKPQKSVLDGILFDDPSTAAQIVSRTWAQGSSLVTVRTLKSAGWCEATIRRPSGIAKFLMRLENPLKGESWDQFSGLSTMAHLALDSSVDEALMRNMVAAAAQHDTSPSFEGVRGHSRSGSSLSDPSLPAMETPDLLSSAEPEPGVRRTKSVNVSNAGRAVDERQSAGADNVPRETNNVAALLRETFQPKDAPSPDINAPYPFKDDNLLDPGFVISQMSTYPDLTGRLEESIRILPDDDGTNRAIAVLDRIPVVDFHKIGVVYLGHGQTTEAEILRNSKGSAAYHEFLAGLGSFNRLRDLRDVYTGGLDISQDLDGEYSLFWEDEGSQIAFHVTTLMPNSDSDPACTGKKRHIGNDYVLIVFNESGLDYQFRTIASQFNFVNFVVAPVTGYGRGLRSDATSDVPSLFSVKMQCRDDMPDFGPLADTKIVSAASLAVVVRQLATHADTFAQIFYLNSLGAKADWISNWRERLRQIRRAKDRASKLNEPQEDRSLLDRAVDFTRYV